MIVGNVTFLFSFATFDVLLVRHTCHFDV